MQHRAGGSPQTNISGPEHLERHQRRVQQISHFMSEDSEPFGPPCGFGVNCRLIALASVLGHRAGDRIVQALVQRAKVAGTDGCVEFNGEFGDGLTDIAIVVHHLGDRESLTQQVASMLDRASPDLRGRQFAQAECILQLIEEHRDTVVDLRFSWQWNRARGHLRPAPAAYLISIEGNEFVEHKARSIRPCYRSSSASDVRKSTGAEKGVPNWTPRITTTAHTDAVSNKNPESLSKMKAGDVLVSHPTAVRRRHRVRRVRDNADFVLAHAPQVETSAATASPGTPSVDA